MNKIFLTILIIILIASTAYFAAKPVMIKEIRFYDSSLSIENQEIEAKTLEPKIVPQKVVKKVETQKIQTPKVQPVKTTPKATPRAIPRATQKPKVTPKPTPRATQKPVPKAQPKPKMTSEQTLKPKAVKQTPQKSPPKAVPKTPPKAPIKSVSKPQPVKKTLTAKEETIVWNQWRSNVDNEIVKLMVSTKLLNRSYAKRIDYTFDVDTAQNISNINITVSPERTQSETEPKFRQIISMLNKSAVLKFPQNTQRTKVTVKDAVHHDGNGRDSNDSDYSDYEKVKTQLLN